MANSIVDINRSEAVEDVLRIINEQSQIEEEIDEKLVATERPTMQAHARGELDNV